MALPALGSVQPESSAPPQQSSLKPQFKLAYGTLGKTRLKVTRVAFGCMTTSDPSVIERAADLGINYFDTARVYQGGNNERMVGAALKKYRDKVYIASKTRGTGQESRPGGPGDQPEGAADRPSRHLASAQQEHAGRW